ncbi:MAG: response regulator transcription factor [Thermoanaerobaculia bacterium]
MTSNRRILIVDDEPNIVLSLEFLLGKAGYEVVVARDGESALAAAASSQPALVVLDLMLPDIDGYEVCRRLRQDPATAAVRIVVLTARGRDAERVRGLEEGADAYVTKPFSTRELIATVNELLGRSAP